MTLLHCRRVLQTGRRFAMPVIVSICAFGLLPAAVAQTPKPAANAQPLDVLRGPISSTTLLYDGAVHISMKIEANGRSYRVVTTANTVMPEGWKPVPENHADSCTVRGRIKGEQITASSIKCLGLSDQKMEISAGAAQGLLLQKTSPIYPPLAKAARVSGTVVLQVTISKTGAIENLRAVSGPLMLRQPALDAVKSWTYKPYHVKGKPVEVQTTVNVIFTLGGSSGTVDDADKRQPMPDAEIDSGEEHPARLIGEWSGSDLHGAMWTFRLKADGTAMVTEQTSNGSMLYQEGQWRVSHGTLFYDMESQHKSSGYRLKDGTLSIDVDSGPVSLTK